MNQTTTKETTKMKTITTLSALFLCSCAVAPREKYVPYEWKTVEGLMMRQQCLQQCPTYDACSMSYLEACVGTAKQVDVLVWNKQNNKGDQ